MIYSRMRLLRATAFSPGQRALTLRLLMAEASPWPRQGLGMGL